ncbi:NAD-dependent epimerase/dehydratase family protein [Aneurinibacillus sp. BA2021]|nr:NAD-dependent epimerase/dehydratase family protein [Aneurinibacillus sp. BA2021]
MAEAPTVLVTGCNGFVGRHMCRHLLSQHSRVIGVGREEKAGFSEANVCYRMCDLRDPKQVCHLIETEPFDYVIHLAAAPSATVRWESFMEIVEANVRLTAHLLEAVRLHGAKRVKGILLAGSAHEYSHEEGDEPELHEGIKAAPSSPYGWSKYMQTVLGQMYAKHYGLPVLITRTFNLIGPGAVAGVCASFADQICAMEREQQKPLLQAGNIHVARDFLDVRDAVRAYWSLLSVRPHPPGEVYNVCSGRPSVLSDMLALLAKYAKVEFLVRTQPQLLREGEARTVYGSCAKLHKATLFRPEFSLEQSLIAMLEERRRHFAEEGSIQIR